MASYAKLPTPVTPVKAKCLRRETLKTQQSDYKTKSAKVEKELRGAIFVETPVFLDTFFSVPPTIVDCILAAARTKGYHDVHSIARTSDGRDILIHLISKGKQGLQDLDILQYVATGHREFLGNNHRLPMLRMLVLEDMTFAVFPFKKSVFSYPWYYDVEVFDAVLQVFRCINTEWSSIDRVDPRITR
ncbi:hypothetical protein PILCRDRAFT_10019 [Piloderma croceum F 1598]|uniref:Uncharacterized protein n=1 Tax=Piloderma croceum (strain F 1598) TaxID=765440 RepID=A0A0C3F552_PILCF|nr:hypothetical protein PILCRDRAFT_10019 [Piloderma croceum F 1598]